MLKNIAPVIVTCYYKLNLETQSTKSYKAKRTTQTYLDYFSFWARVQNTFIIYTDQDIEEQIYAMREKHGLRDKTIVIKKPLESFDSKALDSIRKVFIEYDQSSNRFDPEHPPHTSPEYNYLMYCKSFCVCDAITNPLTQNQNLEKILWLDFGYNLGGNTYTNSEEFDFTFMPEPILQDSKLNLFSLGTTDSRTLPHILIHGTKYFITGGVMYGSSLAWQKFNSHMKEALKAFITFNIIDDDQKLAIWCVRNYPDDFHIVTIDGWFHAIYYFMPESKRKNISTKIPSILQESLQQSDIKQHLSEKVKQDSKQIKFTKKHKSLLNWIKEYILRLKSPPPQKKVYKRLVLDK